ncbi:MAG: hypothetical protein ACLQAT_31425 [Candidatus Binataceae bacterium]
MEASPCVSAVTAGGTAQNRGAIAFASIVGGSGDSNLSGTAMLMLAGLILLPFGIRTRRRSAAIFAWCL